MKKGHHSFKVVTILMLPNSAKTLNFLPPDPGTFFLVSRGMGRAWYLVPPFKSHAEDALHLITPGVLFQPYVHTGLVAFK